MITDQNQKAIEYYCNSDWSHTELLQYAMKVVRIEMNIPTVLIWVSIKIRHDLHTVLIVWMIKMRKTWRMVRLKNEDQEQFSRSKVLKCQLIS